MNFPEIRVGDSAEIEIPTKILPDGTEVSEAEGWQVSLSLKGGGNNYDSVAQYSWTIGVTALITAAFKAGIATFAIIATKAAAKKTIYFGQITILPDVGESDGTFDNRTPAKKTLDAVIAAIQALMTGGVIQEYDIAGTSIKRYSLEALKELKKDLSQEVLKEEQKAAIKAGRKNPRSVYVRFTE